MFVKIENLISLFQNLPQILYNVIPIRRVFTRRTQFSCNIVEKTFKIQEKRCNIKTRTNLAKSCKVNRHCNCCHKNILLQDLSRPLGRSFTKSSQFCEIIYPTLFSLFFTKTRFSQMSFSIFQSSVVALSVAVTTSSHFDAGTCKVSRDRKNTQLRKIEFFCFGISCALQKIL